MKDSPLLKVADINGRREKIAHGWSTTHTSCFSPLSVPFSGTSCLREDTLLTILEGPSLGHLAEDAITMVNPHSYC